MKTFAALGCGAAIDQRQIAGTASTQRSAFLHPIGGNHIDRKSLFFYLLDITAQKTKRKLAGCQPVRPLATITKESNLRFCIKSPHKIRPEARRVIEH